MVTKQPEQTRHKILEAALWEIYRHGFKGASLDRILEGTGLTKGALYYHFPSKLELGYAVVDEVIRRWIEEHWIEPLNGIDDPIEGLVRCVRRELAEMPDEIACGGCPLNNLTQEMAAVDEGFRLRTEKVLNEWQSGIAQQLRRGQANGTVRPDVDPDATAFYLVGSLQGAAGLAKAARSRKVGYQIGEVFIAMLDGLRPAGARVALAEAHT
jgi:TetR/AcrR family transcriptional regulator, transcriptional repressor for nem operon